LRRNLPARTGLSASPLMGPFPPLWSDGDTWDAHGDHIWGSKLLVSYEKLYRSQPAVASCVNKLVRQISTLPIRVLKVNGPDNKTPVTSKNDPLRSLLSVPAPRKSEMDFKQWFAMSALTHGNSLLAKFREAPGEPPTALLPVNWQYVAAYGEQGGPIEWWSTSQTGQERFFEVEESLHFAWDSPSGEVGTSPLEQLGVTLRLEDAAQRYSTSSFFNAVRPSLAVTLPADRQANKEVRDGIREEIQATHGGVDKAFLTMVIGGGADVKPLSHSAAEAQLVDQRRLQFEEICRVYDVSPQMLGDTRDSSYSTMTEVQKMLYKTTLMPWLELLSQTIQSHLIEGEEAFAGREIQIDFREQLRGTPSEELASIVQGVINGVIAVNEGRQLLGMEKIDDEKFDTPYLPRNNLTPTSGAAALGDGRSDPNNPQGNRGGTAAPIEKAG
jgi:HK97 family phage portal protein